MGERTTVYMVRHAESPFVFGQEKTRGLSEEGLLAAKLVADKLSGVSINHVASSNYTRAVQTVQYVADSRNLPIEQFEELRERAIKGLDYKAPWEELEAAIERSFTYIDYALAGGETTRQAQMRSIPIVQKLLSEHRGGNIVIGTHGNIMTAIMNFYDNGYGGAFWKRTSKPDIYRLAFEENQLAEVERMWA
jgi:2,3-bisphosphoglycerate-dependent phosphoglycerate mutase